MELGVGLLISPRTKVDEHDPRIRTMTLRPYEIPRDSTLGRLNVGELQVRYSEVEEEGWPVGSEMMAIFARYDSEASATDVSKVFFMTSSPEDEAPEIVMTFAEDQDHLKMTPSAEDALELRSILMAAHEIQ